nr:26S proteasome non-ATPase regulatory subunit 4 homolog [Tanacetum cinerariifolium]GEX20340.1 26S proteasome non-ATPase regulatory subunit 4 homolog [Tanacetum cinerariifolium]
MQAEATMICVDNSRCMIQPLFQEQSDAIKYYCTEKLNANPMNVVGIASMADRYLSIATYPTRDLETIMLGVPDAVIDAERVWCTDLNKDLQKRIVVFAGGELKDDTVTARRLGQWLKKWDIAFDAVNFADQSSHKKELFETLVNAAENKRNSRVLHVEPHLSVSQALASSQIIPTRVGESCSPTPDIKDKEYYSRIPYVSHYDMIAKSIEYVFQYADCINAAHEAAAITEADADICKETENNGEDINEHDGKLLMNDEDAVPEITKWEAIAWLTILTLWVPVVSGHLFDAI